jgi:hypothetical protein
MPLIGNSVCAMPQHVSLPRDAKAPEAQDPHASMIPAGVSNYGQFLLGMEYNSGQRSNAVVVVNVSFVVSRVLYLHPRTISTTFYDT